MKVLLIMEWDNPKDQERRNQYTELARSSYEFWDKYSDVKFERLGSWTDNTGHIISLMLYDSMEEYGKMWMISSFIGELFRVGVPSITTLFGYVDQLPWIPLL